MSGFEINPNLLAELEASLAPKLERATGEMASALDENLARGERSGVKYPRLPYRSSAPSEFPQEQSSQLREGVFHEATDDPLTRHVGIKDNSQGKLNALEFGYPEGGMAKRAPVARTVESEDVQAAALKAMEGDS